MALSATMKQMLAIFLAMAIGLDLCTFLLTQRNRAKRVVLGKALYGSKHEGERRCIQLALVWIAAVVVVIATQAYEHWGKWGYLAFCTSCASLYVTLPYLFPGKIETHVYLQSNAACRDYHSKQQTEGSSVHRCK